MKFTMETEVDNSLAFLDVLITKFNNSFTHTVYRKQTHTNRYLHANSHHHPAQTNSVLNSLIHRSIQLTDNQNRPQELDKLKSALLQNGYNNAQIDKSIRHQLTRPPKTDDQEDSIQPHKAFLPYIKGVTDKISNILRKHEIKTIFTANNQISKFLRSPKDTIPNESQGIYEIPCSECPRTYIGQTNRRITARVYEHELAVRQASSTSALYKHREDTGHKIDFSNTKTIATEKTLQTRIIREALEIEKRPNCLNTRDDGRRLPNTWKPLIARIPSSRANPVPAQSSSPRTNLFPAQNPLRANPVHTSSINTVPQPTNPQFSRRSRQIETLERASDETWGVGRLRPRRQVTKS